MTAFSSAVALLFAALPCQAEPAFAPTHDPHLDAPSAEPDGPAFTALLQCASAQGKMGYKLTLEGAKPFAPLWMELVSGEGFTSAQCARADAHGRFERTLRGIDALGALSLRAAGIDERGALALAFTGVGPHAAAKHAPYQSGKIVVSEIMKDPKFVSDTSGEWIEVVNRTNQAIDLEGWMMDDGGSDQHTIQNGGQGVWLAPGAHAVLARNGNLALNGGVAAHYVYAGFSLSNASDAVRLVEPSGVVSDAVEYDDGIFWPDTPGASLNLAWQKVNAKDNDDPNSWCDGSAIWFAGNPDLGSPGLVNPTCP